MKQQCNECQKAFLLEKEQVEMLARLSPVIGGVAYPLPSPTRCPDCRQRRRLAARNDKNYYKNTCGSCKKNVISVYSPDKNLSVFCHDCFWSDNFNPLQYGQAYDFDRPFFEQFNELKQRVPRLCIFNTQSENSDYTVHSSKNKNCYMCASTMRSEDVLFSDWAIGSRDSAELVMCNDMELCYACNDSQHCFGSEELDLCSNCSECTMCFDCHGSQKLIGCVSVNNQNCKILNEPSTQEEAEKTRTLLMTDRAFRTDFLIRYEALKRGLPKREVWNLNTENCSGDYLKNSKNALQCYSSMELEDCMYNFDTIQMKDCIDITRGSFTRIAYECEGTTDLSYGYFSNLAYQCSNVLYCDNANGSKDCFGCFSIKNAKYCILNQQYTEGEYRKMIPKIIAQMQDEKVWGEFFPIQISSFGYNETKAQESFPLQKENALKREYSWCDYEQKPPEHLRVVEANQLPENIADVPDDVLNIIIACEETGRPFRIIPQELGFYRKRALPLPRKHPHVRLAEIARRQNPRTLHSRLCSKCNVKIQTTYGPDRPEAVYCDACYLKEVY